MTVWKKKIKSPSNNEENKDLDIFRTVLDNDYNYKNIQLPQEVEGMTIIEGNADQSGEEPSANEVGMSGSSGTGPSANVSSGPSTSPEEIEIPEWEMPDSAYIPKVPEKKDDHPAFWAFKRLLNRMIDQLNWFLKYMYGTAEVSGSKEPSALAFIWAIILMVIVLFVQVIFLLPNLISYFSEFIGICFAAIVFELGSPGEDKEKYRRGIDAAIEGSNGMVGTFVALFVTLNLWFAIAVRESNSDIVSSIENTISKTLFNFFKHGMAGAFLFHHMFGRMKLGKPMKKTDDELAYEESLKKGSTKMMGGGPNPAELLASLSGGKTIGEMASSSSAKVYEKLIDKIKKNPTIMFIVLFSIIYGSFMGGAFDKLMDSQNTIKSSMGGGGGSPIWYIIIVVCMVASAASFLADLPGKFNPFAPLLSGFHILMLLIATLVTFQLGSMLSIMIIFYFMFIVIPLESFGNWKDTISTIFNSFKNTPRPNPKDSLLKKVFMRYGVIIVFGLALLGSSIRMMVNVGKALPPNPKLSGAMSGLGIAGVLFTFFIMYKFIFPENIKGLIELIMGHTNQSSDDDDDDENASLDKTNVVRSDHVDDENASLDKTNVVRSDHVGNDDSIYNENPPSFFGSLFKKPR